MATFTVNTHHAYLNNDILIKADGSTTIVDIYTENIYQVKDQLATRLTAGLHLLKSDNHEEEIFIEDAVKFGGSRIIKAFVFDENPWSFVTTKDRLYASNSKTHEEKVEYGITPDEIVPFPTYMGADELFRFKTKDDYAIFNVLTGKIPFQYTGHIFSNNHLIIFKNEDGVEVYDYRLGETIIRFDGQYDLDSNNLFFVNGKRLYALSLEFSHISKISYVGIVEAADILTGNHLLKLTGDYYNKKYYLYYSLEDVEHQESMIVTKILSPYYIESWLGNHTWHFEKAKEELCLFNKACRDINQTHDNVHSLCLGLRVSNMKAHIECDKQMLEIQGELVSYPISDISVPFEVTGQEGETIDFAQRIIIFPHKEDKCEVSFDTSEVNFPLGKTEIRIGESDSRNRIVTRENGSLFVRDLGQGKKFQILQDIFDMSYFSNAYFASDGKTVLLQDSNKDMSCLELDDMKIKSFDVEGFTLSRNEGYNGYKPEVSLEDNRTSVWRDPITLQFIPKEDMSSRIFKSPDGRYCADTQMTTINYNRLTKSEIGKDDMNVLKKEYNWDDNATKEEIDEIVERRRALVEKNVRDDLFGKIKEEANRYYSNSDKEERDKKIEDYIKKMMDYYITKERDFASLIIDQLGYVNYRKTDEGSEDKRLLIGRSVLYLNYVSFSYDSKYLCFAAKMNKDNFRNSQMGVFEIIDLESGTVVNRTENLDNKELWAVWMAMFSKKGDVAFYDSHANAYLKRPSDNYVKTEEAPGKSLLCFSPSGNYIACSDQKYIDYAHHSNENWGHQPSGNVYILSVDDFPNCLEQYNDVGDSVVGVASRAGSVSSAAFSQDDTRLLVVGNDGVVVRNLKTTSNDNIAYVDENDGYDSVWEDDYGTSYGKYAGSYAQDVMGYSDDAIDDAFEGDPDAYWNID